MSIQFFDCPNCGKSLRVGARSCHHCHALDENDWADPDTAAEHATGGYALEAPDEDDAKGGAHALRTTLWRRVVIGVVILLLISFILPYLLPLYRTSLGEGEPGL
jgi:hypothetical protein